MIERIAIIGVGNMGKAIADKLESYCDLNLSNSGQTNQSAIEESDIVILCVKPQMFATVAQEIGLACAGRLVISIMAGIRLVTISQVLGSTAIVRSMPNLGLKYGESMTGWTTNGLVNSNQKEFVRNLFNSWGKQLEVDDEDKLNKLTAISGSGPAYFFYMAEAMQKAAVQMGFTQEESDLIVRQTFVAASKTQDNFVQARANVTSKGGTTAEAVDSLEKNHVSDAMIEAINQAYLRAQELSK